MAGKRKSDANGPPASMHMTTPAPPIKKRKETKTSVDMAPGGTKRAAYTSQQKKDIAEFSGITQADKTTAAKILKQANWNISTAVDIFYQNPSSNSASNAHRAALSKIFDKYRDDPRNAPDEIGVEGTGSLLNDMEIELSDVGALVFSELVQSPSLGTIAREPFLDGCSDAGADSLPKLRDIVLQRRARLATDRELFKNVYTHTFTLALQERQKALPPDLALEFWKVLFTAPAYEWRTAATPWREWWFEFYEARVNKAVNKDLWKQTLSFATATMKDDSLGFWSEESSWPSVIDEFVEWVKAEKRPGSGGAGSGGDVMEE